jgi:hypothetical protein
MTPRDFTYWLQGFVEITDQMERPSEQQWLVIKEHLALTMKKHTINTVPTFDKTILMETEDSGMIKSGLASSFGKKNVSINC